jgi:hypothetical protein
MRTKKGENEGLSVAIIIGTIMAMLVIYVIVIPTEDRLELLNETDFINDDSTSADLMSLLNATPGELSADDETFTTHQMPNINLYVKDKPEIEPLASRLSVFNSWFSEGSPTLKFNIYDLENIKTADLFVSVLRSEGELGIKLNGKLVEESFFAPGIQSISLPIAYLAESNELVFETSTPLTPWGDNTYRLEEIALKKKFELINSQENRIIDLEQTELDSIKDTTLDFFQICNLAPVKSSTLRILVNEQEAHRGTLHCINTRQEIEIPESYFQAGENIFTFIVDGGDFSITQVELEVESKIGTYPTYYFKLDSSEIDDVEDNDADVILDMIFSDKKTRKATILVNSHKIKLSTDQPVFTKDISAYVREGTNILKIVPQNRMDVAALNVNFQ